jgi:hypothetical protein
LFRNFVAAVEFASGGMPRLADFEARSFEARSAVTLQGHFSDQQKMLVLL